MVMQWKEGAVLSGLSKWVLGLFIVMKLQASILNPEFSTYSLGDSPAEYFGSNSNSYSSSPLFSSSSSSSSSSSDHKQPVIKQKPSISKMSTVSQPVSKSVSLTPYMTYIVDSGVHDNSIRIGERDATPAQYPLVVQQEREEVPTPQMEVHHYYHYYQHKPKKHHSVHSDSSFSTFSTFSSSSSSSSSDESSSSDWETYSRSNSQFSHQQGGPQLPLFLGH